MDDLRVFCPVNPLGIPDMTEILSVISDIRQTGGYGHGGGVYVL